MNIRIVDGDLLTQDVEAIVNAWNRNVIPWWLLLPQGVSGAIKRAAGYEPFRELARAGRIPLGGAVVTGAGRLRFKAQLRAQRALRHRGPPVPIGCDAFDRRGNGRPGTCACAGDHDGRGVEG